MFKEILNVDYFLSYVQTHNWIAWKSRAEQLFVCLENLNTISRTGSSLP